MLRVARDVRPRRTPACRLEKRVRRSAADLQKTAERIVALVKSSKKGISAEKIRAALKVPRSELVGPLGLALVSKKIRKRGKKRATTYFA